MLVVDKGLLLGVFGSCVAAVEGDDPQALQNFQSEYNESEGGIFIAAAAAISIGLVIVVTFVYLQTSTEASSFYFCVCIASTTINREGLSLFAAISFGIFVTKKHHRRFGVIFFCPQKLQAKG